MSILAYWTKDAEQIERIFHSSKLAKTLDRKKGHEEDYLNRSIRKALKLSQGIQSKGLRRQEAGGRIAGRV